MIRIVLIEDSEDDYILVREALKSGFNDHAYDLQWLEVAPVPDAFIREYDPDVILIDYRLSGMDGIEFSRELRLRNPYVSIILLTGLSERDLDDIDQQTAGIAISDFVSKKDINGSTLCRAVRYANENANQRRLLQHQATTIEYILKRTEVVTWSESRASEDAKANRYYSGSIEELTGYSRQEFETGRMSILDLVVQVDRERVEMQQTTPEDGEVKIRYRIQRKDGIERWVEETRETSHFRGTDSISSVLGCIRDITKEVKTENQNQLLVNSLDQASDAILITDSNLERPGPTIIYVNEAMCRLSGYTASELLGQSPRIFQGPKTDRSTLDELKTKLRQGKIFIGMTTNYRKDRSEFILSWRVSPVLNETGQITHFISSQTDVTRRVYRDQKIHEQDNFLREIGSMAKVGGWRYEKESDRLIWTDQIYEIHGLPKDKPIDVETTLSFYTEDAKAKIESAFRDCLEQGIPYEFTLSIRNRQGQLRWCRMQGIPTWRHARITGAWGVIQDVTETREKSIELEKALKEANYANEAKNQFLMMMSHELRTPLNPIIGFTELLLMDVTDPEQSEFLRQIKVSATHLVELISGILEIASIQSGCIHLDSKPLPIVATIHEVVAMLVTSANEKGLKLEFNDNGYLGSVPPLICLGDGAKVRQIVINIINNAIKFTETGSILVEFMPSCLSDDEAELSIRFTDTGIGIAAEEMDKIFSRFYQVDMAASRKFGGQGIGLNLCRDLAGLMGGSITVTSEVGVGSTFTFALKMPRSAPPPESPDPEIGPFLTEKTLNTFKVLVVEDDSMNRIVISQLLHSMSIKHELAEDGIQALVMLEREPYDLVLMDIQMPSMSGLETTRKIRESDKIDPNIAVVALSAHVLEDIKEEAVNVGMMDFLEKPITHSKLQEFFDRFLCLDY
ncbi:MAG: response regulator [Opitutaceae bacterium]